MIQWICC